MKRLFIVVDFQNDFVTGTLGFPGAEQLEAPICQKIEAYRTAGQDVIYTMDTHTDSYLQTAEGYALPIVHCVKGTPGWELYGRTAKLLQGCRRFEKPCFGCADLIPFLQEKQYDEVELGGLVSNICVLSNAVLAKAALPEATVFVDASCTAAADARQNVEALHCMEGMQIHIVGDSYEH
ncbi:MULTISPECIES: cysteine hydrolase family protein [Caproicibacterium]|jgi:nicotinamidase-related amidase|uniref:Isochorismatase family protein n=1 Tax=Caproicibacterium lactatifermentans TaxID=2666138 RepID=A0A859DQI9_9FIRM|nr:isochorismatase family cysteine hydrolase [Caproicibacterium lactatifermentans]ARP50148.1 N-carbamoylsarcosine amidohydrolase [Ruminococcaceae bacterium CPB6]QKN24128.1 isochorismatase family protein [Caproicibacterium lactatifermentans]QKO30803.1 isochorismatase family protein [Caproicibacterium lactatifermentans]